MVWRVARSLDQLLAQLNALVPNRSRASDGSIGDAAHQAQGSASDHNPWFVLNSQALVTARDFTHDPANGLDCNKLAAALIEARDPRVKYLIWQGRLMDSRAVAGNNYRPWTWQPSSGHYQHLHLSVMANATADDPRPWSLPGLATEEEPDLNTAQNAALGSLWGGMIGVPDGQKPLYQQHLDFVVEELTRRHKPQLAAIQAQLAAIAADPNITPEQLDAAVNRAVAEHSATAEDIAAAMAPAVAAEVVALLPRDDDGNLAVDVDEEHIAELVVTITGNKLSTASPAVQASEEG